MMPGRRKRVMGTRNLWQNDDNGSPPTAALCAHNSLRSSQDATFEFERRRNRPERYDRNVMGATLKVRARRRCRGEERPSGLMCLTPSVRLRRVSRP